MGHRFWRQPVAADVTSCDGMQRGEVSQRILACGSLGRAKMLGRLLKPLDGQLGVRTVESSRGFLTVTGQWKGQPVSIVTHLMGFANMDLFLRETRAVVDEPLLVIRIGTCGSLNSEVGQVHIASKGSVAILRNPDAFMPPENGTCEPPYRISRSCLPDAALTQALVKECTELLGKDGVHLFHDQFLETASFASHAAHSCRAKCHAQLLACCSWTWNGCEGMQIVQGSWVARLDCMCTLCSFCISLLLP